MILLAPPLRNPCTMHIVYKISMYVFLVVYLIFIFMYLCIYIYIVMSYNIFEEITKENLIQINKICLHF